MPADAKSETYKTVVFEVFDEALIGMDAVPGNGFAVPLFTTMLYGDGNFDEFALYFCKVGVKTGGAARLRICFLSVRRINAAMYLGIGFIFSSVRFI